MGAAEGDGATGLSLQRQAGHFQHVGQRQALVCAVRLQHADPGEARAQALFKTGDIGVHALVGAAMNNRFDGGVAAPEIRATQGSYAGDLHVSSFLSAVPSLERPPLRNHLGMF
ncbi:hypothetical protein SDC9_136527 [bioreactor metagenome]|uniref:Uncharacterized protein n=1 Tax=bioreactor metagenome TaxID=1076179 RepID=A0A645DK32_9ZZZZ